MYVSEEAEGKPSKNPGGSCVVRRTTTSTGSATPGSGKRQRSEACARLWTLCKGQRFLDLPGEWRGTSRWNGNSAGISSERTTEDRGKLGAQGGNVGLSARHLRDNRGCFGAIFSHASVGKGSRRDSAGRKIAGYR